MIDYTLCSAESFGISHDFEVVELDSIFSDGHAFLDWSIKCIIHPSSKTENSNNYSQKIKWSERSKDVFISSIDTNALSKLHEQLETIQINQINPADSAESINGLTDGIADIFIQAASKSLKQSKQPYKRRIFDKPWFGPACKIARKKYHRARNAYNHTKSAQAKKNLQTESKLYKQTVHKYIRLHKVDKIKKLRNMQTKNPKEYWKYLNSLQQKPNQ